jgi:hypothetical protein
MSDVVTIEKEITFAFDNFESYSDDDQIRLVVALPKCINMQKVGFDAKVPILYGLLWFFSNRILRTDNHSGIHKIISTNSSIITSIIRETELRLRLQETLTQRREKMILNFLDFQRVPKVPHMTFPDMMLLAVNGKTADNVAQTLMIEYTTRMETYNNEMTKKTNSWRSRDMDFYANGMISLAEKFQDMDMMPVFRTFVKMKDNKNVEHFANTVPEVRKYLLLK